MVASNERPCTAEPERSDGEERGASQGVGDAGGVSGASGAYARRVFVALLTSSLVSACAAPLRFTIDPTFAPEQHVEIMRAAETWNRITVPSRRIRFDGDVWYIAAEEPPRGFNGWCSRSQRRIEIRRVPIDASTYAVALHELGHALGLDDLAEDGVMHGGEVHTEFSASDMAECRRVGSCKP